LKNARIIDEDIDILTVFLCPRFNLSFIGNITDNVLSLSEYLTSSL